MRACADCSGAPPIYHAPQLPSRRSLNPAAPAASAPPCSRRRPAPLRPLAAHFSLVCLEPVVIRLWVRGPVDIFRQAVNCSLLFPHPSLRMPEKAGILLLGKSGVPAPPLLRATRPARYDCMRKGLSWRQRQALADWPFLG